ncbi:MAG: hypothetical protein SH821_13895 [Phototrophicales bacterium]|nr:hypothetical protein [Phototrophicales bacterium]
MAYGGDIDAKMLDQFFDEIAQSQKGNSPIEIRATETGIDIGNFKILPIGLQIADGVSVDEWQAFGQHIRMMQISIQWIIGDWLAYGERVYGKTYQDVVDLTGYTYETLRNLAWVAKAFDLSYRYDKLSHTHHQTALALCNGDVQVTFNWLQTASDNGWSIKKMSDEIKGVPPAPPLVSGKLGKFWHETTVYMSKQRKLADRVGGDERAEMVRGLRILADEIEKIGSDGSKKRR